MAIDSAFKVLGVDKVKDAIEKAKEGAKTKPAAKGKAKESSEESEEEECEDECEAPAPAPKEKPIKFDPKMTVGSQVNKADWDKKVKSVKDKIVTIDIVQDGYNRKHHTIGVHQFIESVGYFKLIDNGTERMAVEYTIAEPITPAVVLNEAPKVEVIPVAPKVEEPTPVAPTIKEIAAESPNIIIATMPKVEPQPEPIITVDPALAPSVDDWGLPPVEEAPAKVLNPEVPTKDCYYDLEHFTKFRKWAGANGFKESALAKNIGGSILQCLLISKDKLSYTITKVGEEFQVVEITF